MGQKEIERKWLIDNPPDLSSATRIQISQGYIARNSSPHNAIMTRPPDSLEANSSMRLTL